MTSKFTKTEDEAITMFYRKWNIIEYIGPEMRNIGVGYPVWGKVNGNEF